MVTDKHRHHYHRFWLIEILLSQGSADAIFALASISYLFNALNVCVCGFSFVVNDFFIPFFFVLFPFVLLFFDSTILTFFILSTLCYQVCRYKLLFWMRISGAFLLFPGLLDLWVSLCVSVAYLKNEFFSVFCLLAVIFLLFFCMQVENRMNRKKIFCLFSQLPV